MTPVRDLQQDGHRVLLVGDGVNDGPALAAADIGVAMGSIGSGLVPSSANAAIVRDDLGTLAAVTRLSRRARRLIVQNLLIAATVIAVLVTWDLLGHLPLPVGVAGHEGSTILVALNGLRLLRSSEWKHSATSNRQDRRQGDAPVNRGLLRARDEVNLGGRKQGTVLRIGADEAPRPNPQRGGRSAGANRPGTRDHRHLKASRAEGE